MNEYKQYIGDSIYVEWDGYGLLLTTENGCGTSNSIYMGPRTLKRLEEYQAWLKHIPEEKTS
jgi:hypothetical protein